MNGLNQDARYERFDSMIYYSSNEFLSVGWSNTGGQREDVVLEFYKIENESVQLVATAAPEQDLDLPIWAFAYLADGRLLFTSEGFQRTFEVRPPFVGEIDAFRSDVGWGWQDEDLVTTLRPFKSQGEPFADAEIIWTRSGVFGKQGEDFVYDGFECRRFLDHENTDQGCTLSLKLMDNSDAVWHTDVPITRACELRDGKFLIIKQSGPEIIKLLGDLKVNN